jgi:hypothetical protein
MSQELLRNLLVTATAAGVLAMPVAGQQPPPAAPPPARAEDVASIDAIIAVLYDVISGPAAQPRDWDRFHSLFQPDARLIPTGQRPDGTVTARTLTPEEFSATVGPQFEERGFFEQEIGRVAETFGNIAHVFSAYESKRTAEDPEPFARGINSIQLLNADDRWYIVSIFWDSERPGNPIPAKYLRR